MENMTDGGIFKKYYSRLAKEGIIKAIICGVIVGFSLGIIFSVAALLFNSFANINNFDSAITITLLISIGIWVLAAVAAAPLFYFWLFKPKARQIAERIDRLGLDERMITMMELSKDESYIALRQREDAKEKLNEVKREHLQFYIFSRFLKPLIAAGILLLCAACMVSVPAFTFKAPVAWEGGGDYGARGYAYVLIVYSADENGFVDGWTNQEVTLGEDTMTVKAIPHIGYEFLAWSDGVATAERKDRGVLKDQTYVAIFVESDDELMDKDKEDEGDGEDGGDAGGGGKDRYIETNYIIDGQTYYRDRYQEFYDEAMQYLAESREVPDYLRSIVERYFGIIV